MRGRDRNHLVKVRQFCVEKGSGFTLTSSCLIFTTLKEECESRVLGDEGGWGMRGELMLQRIKVTCPRPRSYKVADPGFDSACVALNFTH